MLLISDKINFKTRDKEIKRDKEGYRIMTKVITKSKTTKPKTPCLNLCTWVGNKAASLY